MKKTSFIGAVILIAMTSIQVNAYNSKNTNENVIADSLQKTEIDLVCKMKVKPKQSKVFTVNKKDYYFCSESCKQKFMATPTKYIKK